MQNCGKVNTDKFAYVFSQLVGNSFMKLLLLLEWIDLLQGSEQFRN